MTISTNHKFVSVSSSQQEPVDLSHFDRNTIEVCMSDAEAKVITSKANKAGMSTNEYIRQAALGFPMP